MLNRAIKLPEKESFFLFGPRQTGKSTLINSLFNKNIWKINLLFTDVFLQYSKDPSLFRKQAEEKILHENINYIFVDEIQKIPLLLDEIHYLLEKYTNCRFILTGSSARKLKRSGTNLLAGRVIERQLFPFTFKELKDRFNFDEILIYGSLPAVYNKTPEQKQDILNTYVHTYLREEIQNEGIVRNLGGFSRFLDVAASQSGELVSFSAIARECSLPVRTVQSYYEILEDTLIGFRLESYKKSIRKRLIAHPKFYIFDLGVTNAINKRLTIQLDPILKGRLFEQYIILETYRKIRYTRSEANIYFWRTSHGSEVDLIIEKHNKIIAAFEIKSTPNITGAHLTGLRSFKDLYPNIPCFIISTIPNAYKIETVKVIPWQYYLDNLTEWI